MKISSIKNFPKNGFLVTIDVSSLYTNIDHEEGAEVCFQKLEERKNKSIASIVIKNLILMILKAALSTSIKNIFLFASMKAL